MVRIFYGVIYSAIYCAISVTSLFKCTHLSVDATTKSMFIWFNFHRCHFLLPFSLPLGNNRTSAKTSVCDVLPYRLRFRFSKAPQNWDLAVLWCFGMLLTLLRKITLYFRQRILHSAKGFW